MHVLQRNWTFAGPECKNNRALTSCPFVGSSQPGTGCYITPGCERGQTCGCHFTGKEAMWFFILVSDVFSTAIFRGLSARPNNYILHRLTNDSFPKIAVRVAQVDATRLVESSELTENERTKNEPSIFVRVRCRWTRAPAASACTSRRILLFSVSNKILSRLRIVIIASESFVFRPHISTKLPSSPVVLWSEKNGD